MCSIILFIMYTWMLQQGIGASNDIKNELTNQNSSPILKLGYSDNTRGPKAGMGFIPETPNIEDELPNEEFPGNNSLKLIKLGNSSYYFSNHKASYFQAFQFCKMHQMDLLNIESELENDMIIGVLKNLTDRDHVWTSGTDLADEGKYFWMTTGEGFTFTQWEPRQPDNILNAEDCVEIRKINKNNYAWNDSYCSYRFNFICEITKCRESFCKS